MDLAEVKKQRIEKKEIDDAYARLQEYKKGKSSLKRGLLMRKNGGSRIIGNVLLPTARTPMIQNQ